MNKENGSYVVVSCIMQRNIHEMLAVTLNLLCNLMITSKKIPYIGWMSYGVSDDLV